MELGIFLKSFDIIVLFQHTNIRSEIHKAKRKNVIQFWY